MGRAALTLQVQEIQSKMNTFTPIIKEHLEAAQGAQQSLYNLTAWNSNQAIESSCSFPVLAVSFSHSGKDPTLYLRE